MGDRRRDRETVPLWPDMKPSFALFCDAPWQWVSLGMAGAMRTNIKRAELEASARLLGIITTPAIFADIRVMEEAALEWWARKR